MAAVGLSLVPNWIPMKLKSKVKIVYYIHRVKCVFIR